LRVSGAISQSTPVICALRSGYYTVELIAVSLSYIIIQIYYITWLGSRYHHVRGGLCPGAARWSIAPRIMNFTIHFSLSIYNSIEARMHPISTLEHVVSETTLSALVILSDRTR
jgi:hypothetical protein